MKHSKPSPRCEGRCIKSMKGVRCWRNSKSSVKRTERMTPSGEISQQGFTDWTQQYNYNRARRPWRQHMLRAPQRRAAVERRIQCSSHGDLPDVADQWRSCSSGWLPEDAEQRKWLLHILPKSQDQEADGGPDDKFSLAPTDPVAPPMSVGQLQQISRLRRREKLHRLVQRKLRAWTRRLRAWTWPGCVRRRGRDYPRRRWQDQMRDKSFQCD